MRAVPQPGTTRWGRIPGAYVEDLSENDMASIEDLSENDMTSVMDLSENEPTFQTTTNPTTLASSSPTNSRTVVSPASATRPTTRRDRLRLRLGLRLCRRGVVPYLSLTGFLRLCGCARWYHAAVMPAVLAPARIQYWWPWVVRELRPIFPQRPQVTSNEIGISLTLSLIPTQILTFTLAWARVGVHT